ncbi:Rho GTPase-activating protein 20 [Caenorhabditis elegans]|uniref:Rho GTPase-activating protein 20 n=1 Tax=Caenorhabditis elegans TaxID=6239 RepID=Q9XW53_CAEEL|nr:Rho GTPase-activating protein 20 [Caenorhabditis elegans]CAA22138.1 Rho GTPase-activating protein 20 [Caenorhabditis elegans]|eukprot:NP_493035.1 Rho GTPase Activating protein [Caenorhabditis elegans]
MISSNSSSTSLNVETDYPTNGKKPLKEGSVQLTSLSTLLSHHRYFFLYHETLIISKQKGACSYKLKEKLRLEKVWIASSNTADSFLIGWPFTNYLVHFRNTEEKDEWFELLSCCVQQCLRPLFTTISMEINVRGRKQTIRRRVDNGKKSGEIVVDTAGDLGLPHTSYQLTLSFGDNSHRQLQGPENVYVAIMSEIERQGTRLSESQKQALDTCPIANCRLILSTIKSTSGPSAKQLVNSIKKKVLTRTDSRSIFGKGLNGPTPPQPIMTIVDHLRMDGFDAEGIFRKSPKQSTFKELKCELDKGVVPDFHKYNTHVLASILKEYLRSIPGKILLSGNYELWMREIADEPNTEKKVSCCRALLSHLPTSHSILLANVLKLLNKISNSPSSKMNASSLSVCLAPSFLESPDPMEGGKKIPPLIEFLISHAAQVMPGFSTDNVFAIMTSPMVDHNANMVCSPAPSSSHSDDGGSSQKTPIIEELNDADDATSQSSLAESDLPDEPRGTSAHLETISEISEPPTNDERLVFSSSEDEDDDDEDELRVYRPKSSTSTSSCFARTSFVSETLKTSADDGDKGLNKETPRSPCLKRIHFQRTEAQHRNKEGNIKLDFEALKFHRPSVRKSSLEEVARKNSAEFFHHSREPSDAAVTPTPPKNGSTMRKESREEATQTADCGLPHISSNDDSDSRFPAFKSSSVAMLTEPYKSSSSSSSSTSSIPSDPAPRPYFLKEEYTSLANKPTVQVAPFSQEPSLKTINDRLNALRQNSILAQEVPQEPVMTSSRLRSEATKSLTNSPIMPRSYGGSLMQKDREEHSFVADDFYKASSRKPELQRSSSQRGLTSMNNNNNSTKQIYGARPSSLKTPRRFAGAGGVEACVGMDPLEINWSVSQLKTLFQDTKAPSIDTTYNMN